MGQLHISISDKLKEEILNADINVSHYIRNLIHNDIVGDKKILLKLKEEIENQKKAQVIKEEMSLIGAVENISQRVKQMSKCNVATYTLLIKKNVELLTLETTKDYYSQSTKDYLKLKLAQLVKSVKQ
jgi:hypothetical protein